MDKFNDASKFNYQIGWESGTSYSASNPVSVTFTLVPGVLIVKWVDTVGDAPFRAIATGDVSKDNFTTFESFTGDNRYVSNTSAYFKRSTDGKTIYWYTSNTTFFPNHRPILYLGLA